MYIKYTHLPNKQGCIYFLGFSLKGIIYLSISSTELAVYIFPVKKTITPPSQAKRDTYFK